MKVGANSPCPCGSDQKYKRCCRKLRKVHKVPKKKKSSSNVPISWPPLKKPMPDRTISGKESRLYLTRRHIDCAEQIVEFLSKSITESTTESAEKGLEMVEKIPLDQLYKLPELFAVYCEFLKIFDRKSEVTEHKIQQLLSVGCKNLWIAQGRKFIEWFPETDKDRHQELIDLLRDVAHKLPFPQPKLILVQTLILSYQTPKCNEECGQLLSEILHPKKWDPFPKHMYPWLNEISHGMFTYIGFILERNLHDEISRIRDSIPKYPWAAASNILFKQSSHMVHMTVGSVGNPEMAANFSHSLVQKNVKWSWPYFYYGYKLSKTNKSSTALKYYRKAMEYEITIPEHIHSMADFFCNNGTNEDLKNLLRLFPDKKSHTYIDYSITLKCMELDDPGALKWCNKGLEYFPNDPEFLIQKALTYEELDRNDEAKEIYNSLMAHENPKVRHKALLNLCFIMDHQEEHEGCLKILQHYMAHADEEENSDPDWQYDFNYQLGATLRSLEQYEKSLKYLLVAQKIKETIPLYLDLISTKAAMEHFEEAHVLLNEVDRKFTEADMSRYTIPAQCDCRYLRLITNEGLGRWKENSYLFDKVGLEWFRKEELLFEGIMFKVTALMSLSKPFEVLSFCGNLLKEIIDHEGLMLLYQQAVKEACEQHRKLGVALDSQLKETHLVLSTQIAQNRRNQKNRKKTFSGSKKPRRADSRLYTHHEPAELPVTTQYVSQKPDEQLRKQYPMICGALPEHLMKILISAELMWNNLVEHSEHDHGPVILQLSRVVEGVVNKRLMDPMAKLSLKMGQELNSLDKISNGTIRRRANQLTLGECAHLLQGRQVRRDSSGIQSVEINPRSTDDHKKLLKTLWNQISLSGPSSKTLFYLKNTLSGDLRKLAKVRNQAGHAGQIISRYEAKEVRAHVLGKDSMLGHLAYLRED